MLQLSSEHCTSLVKPLLHLKRHEGKSCKQNCRGRGHEHTVAMKGNHQDARLWA